MDREQDKEELEGFDGELRSSSSFAIFNDLCSIDHFIDDEELSGPAPQLYRADEDEDEPNAMDHFLAKISE